MSSLLVATPADFSILNDIFQCPTLNPLGMPPSTTEIQHHITKLANNKSPGESGVPAEALKALSPDSIEYVCTLLQDFWEGRRIYEEWQTTLLRVLYKKGNRKEPTNYRGIVLQDAFARTPPQCYHWWPTSPTDEEMWNGGTVCIPRE
jgi:hypothetical protein